MKYLFAFQILFFFNGCTRIESIDDINLPPLSQKLVVYSFLTPGAIPKVNVSINKTINTANNSYSFNHVSDAIVEISNLKTSKKVVLPYTKDGNYLQENLNFEIAEGNEYFLKVSTPDGKIVTSKCKIPISSTIIKNIEYTLIGKQNSNAQDFNFTISWIDSTKNYQKKIHDFYIGKNYIANGKYNSFIEFEQRFVLSNNIFTFSGSGALFNDNKEKKYEITLYTVEQSFSKFFNTAHNMKDLIESSKYQPFFTFKGIFSEFSNIEGGLGVFTSYIKNSKIIILK